MLHITVHLFIVKTQCSSKRAQRQVSDFVNVCPEGVMMRLFNTHTHTISHAHAHTRTRSRSHTITRARAHTHYTLVMLVLLLPFY